MYAHGIIIIRNINELQMKIEIPKLYEENTTKYYKHSILKAV